MSEIDCEEGVIIDFGLNDANFDNVSIMTLTVVDLNPPNDPLPLIHLELIDWEQPEQLTIPIFPDDETIVQYVFSINPKTCSTSHTHNKVLN